jgi:pimeloyl-ACP methyl ester carboxylesterase
MGSRRSKLAFLAVPTLALGVILARTTEPGVTVTRVALSSGPVIRISPVSSGTHPTALLGHGITASKETLFRAAEALAATGFDCLLVDFPGHGESSAAFPGDGEGVLVEGARALTGSNRVDVVVGHSMGASIGARTLRDGKIEAHLLLAFGAVPSCPTETVYLEGAWDELLAAPPGAVVSPWSDHCLEPWDPVLVDAAVKAACAKTGLTPAPLSSWKLRVLGALLVLVGSVVSIVALAPARTGPLVGLGIGAGGLIWPAAGLPLWFAGAPTLAHLPLQVPATLGAAIASWLGVRITGWPARRIQGGFAALGGLLAIAQVVMGEPFGTLIFGIFAAVLALGALLGAFAETRGGSAAAHAAFGLWLGYLCGQWCPRPF